MTKELEKRVKSKNGKMAKVFWNEESGSVYLQENRTGNRHSAGHATSEAEALSKAQTKIDHDEHEFNHWDELED